MQLNRRKFSKEFKLQVINEVDAGKTQAQAAREYQISDNLICKWRQEYLKDPSRAFSGNGNTYKEEARIAQLERMVGKLTMENDFLKKVLAQLRGAGR